MDLNENNDNKMSELIFIKNGKVFRKKFPQVEFGNLIPEEEKLLMQSLGIPKEEFDNLQKEEKYAALTESGWTIIKNIDEHPYSNRIYIGRDITQADYDAVMKILDSKEEPIKISEANVLSRANYKYGRQFEAVDLRELSGKEVIDIFMRDKLGQTTEYEKEMLEHFRTFDLERILTGADASYRFNNRSGGIIVITPDEFLTNACSGKNADHGAATLSIFMNKYNKIFRNNSETMFMFEADIYKSVIIQCSHIGGEGELIVWNPRNINEFQYGKLLELQDELESIEQRSGTKVRVAYSYDTLQKNDNERDDDERNDVPSVYREYLLQRHDQMVDNSIGQDLEKSSLPENRQISEEEVCDCLGIEMPKTKDSEKNIGKDVKKQIFARAKKGFSLFSSEIVGFFRGQEKVEEQEFKR